MSDPVTETVEGLKEVARAILGNPRPTDGAAVGTPGDFAQDGMIGGTYDNDDQADNSSPSNDPSSYARTGMPEQGSGFAERSLAVPGQPSGYSNRSTPMLDSTEWAIEHGDDSIAGVPETAGYERADVRDVYSIGGDSITTIRVALPALGLTEQPLLRNDRRRLRARLRVLTSGKTVTIGNSQAAAGDAVGWPLSDTDQPLVIETQGEVWVRSATAEAGTVVVALMTETRNMPRTV